MSMALGNAVLVLTTDVRGLSSGVDQANSQLGRLGDAADETNKRLQFTQLAISVAAVTEGISRMADGNRRRLQYDESLKEVT